MSTIAIVATYAPSEEFGGPARIHHMGASLRAAGHQVAYVVVAANHQAKRLGQLDLMRVVERPFRTRVDHIYSDVDLAQRALANPAHAQAISAHLSKIGADLVILEHPFLIEVVHAAIEPLGIPLVYSAANIEYRLLRELERFVFDWKRRTDRWEEVREFERRACEIAAAVTAICAHDQQVLRDEFGVEAVLVPNGSLIADHPLPTASPPTHRLGQPVDFAVAGSAYWPNTEGLAKIASPSLAFLPPTTRIHVAGSMANEILRERSVDRKHSANASRLVLRGFLSADELVATFHAARAILVPIFTGEGSNLKTADALASGRPVILTERATRGYEDVIADDDEGVTVVADADEFRAAMSAALRSERSGPVGTNRHRALRWSARVSPLADTVESAIGAS